MGTTNFDTVAADDVLLGTDGVSLTGLLAGVPVDATIGAPAAEAANARSVAVQLLDLNGDDLAVRGVVTGFVSTNATGDAPGDGALTIVVSAGTDGAIIDTDDSGFTAISEVDGDLDLILTDSADGALSVYVHIVGPLGNIVASSAAIAFADDTP